MEERKEVINRFVSRGLTTAKASSIAGMSRSTYYYKPKGGVRGKKPSTFSYTVDGSIVCNDMIINRIKEIISDDFIDYGYDKVTACLRWENLIINPKKVYRLMSENRLLNPKICRQKSNKKYIQFRQPYPGFPLQNLEIDIKYIYIAGLKVNAYLITILDVLSRKALVWDMALSMKSDRVIDLFNSLIDKYLQPRNLFASDLTITLRSDNGSQFIANKVRQFLLDNHIGHEFILPATPQQNAYIESFHSSVEKLVCQKFDFESLKHAKEVFLNFFDTYNFRRILKCIGYLTPDQFFNLVEEEGAVVTYNIKSKKQLIFFRKKQVA